MVPSKTHQLLHRHQETNTNVSQDILRGCLLPGNTVGQEGICVVLVWFYATILPSVTHLIFKLIIALGFAKNEVVNFHHSFCAS